VVFSYVGGCWVGVQRFRPALAKKITSAEFKQTNKKVSLTSLLFILSALTHHLVSWCVPIPSPNLFYLNLSTSV
jgi:hypothetical protein